MLRDRRESGGHFRGSLWFLSLVSVLGALSACTAVAGGGVVAVLVGIGALTAHCYDYLDVTVFDAQGRKTCAATVTASRNKSSEQFELESCYYTPLSDGRWTLRASLPGTSDVETVVDVDHEKDCTRHVQSVELTLNTGVPPARAVRPALAPTPAISATISAPAPVASGVFPQLVTPPTSTAAPSATPGAGAAAGAASDVAPASGGASSLGVFPNLSNTSH
jgi:hypothetical protein